MISNVSEVVKICQTWLADYAKTYKVSFIISAPDNDIASMAISKLCLSVDTNTTVIRRFGDNSDLVSDLLHEPNKILVGSVNRTNGLLNRWYPKRGDEGSSDIYPVYDLFQPECLSSVC